MKKFLEEFRAFIAKGNVLDLAVGVIIGGAFGSVVSGLTDNIIQPLLNCIGGANVQGKIQLFGTENYLDYGAFISAIINFLIMAFVVFLIVKSVNKLSARKRKKSKHRLNLQQRFALIARAKSLSTQQSVLIAQATWLPNNQIHNYNLRCSWK